MQCCRHCRVHVRTVSSGFDRSVPFAVHRISFRTFEIQAQSEQRGTIATRHGHPNNHQNHRDGYPQGVFNTRRKVNRKVKICLPPLIVVMCVRVACLAFPTSFIT